MTERKFFVYGSMGEGLVHFDKIREFVSDNIPATATGTAYRLKVGFPVFLEQGTDPVPGNFVTVRAPELLFQLLDQFHGFSELESQKSLYFRRSIKVETVSGQIEEAWAYVLNPAKLPLSAKRIEGGNWKLSLQTTPPLTEKLTERQRHYVLRLGASTGREIVPIDLPLYRELMNLEIIVDKGRRLALSKLGHEVFRYLA
jgi:gamma-glutamylcyclotransferase (GGCT)/AIG2-like uncharacterized protein YtfP